VTPQFFAELQDKKMYKKKKRPGLKNLSTVIMFDFKRGYPLYQDALKYLGTSGPGLIFSLITKNSDKGFNERQEEETEDLKEKSKKKGEQAGRIFDDEINLLSKLIEQEKKTQKKMNLKEFPVRKPEIDAFRYRVSDAHKSVSLKQIRFAKMIDFKKQLLKSKNMADYYKEHPDERALIIESVRRMQAIINRYSVKLHGDIPDYLLPEFIKEHRKKYEALQEGEKPIKKIISQKWNEDYEKSLAKRVAANNLTMEDVHKRRKMDSDKFITVDERFEDPEITNPEYLKPVSGRKLWKIKHKFSLKKKNKRLEKKGIFQT
jgi:hypothetical protein